MENKNTEKVRKGRFTYLINRSDGTAWIASGTTGRKRKYTLPRSVEIEGREYVCESVEVGAFYCNRRLQCLTVPDTYRYIDEDCFKWCRDLRSVHIGKGLEHYFKWTFGGYQTGRRVFIDPGNPFLKMSSDGNLVMTKDGRTVLAVIPKKTLRTLSVSEGVEKIGEGGISCCDFLEEVRLPSTLREIGPNGIFENRSLRSLKIPEGVSEAGVQAVSFNGSLEVLDLPSTLHKIGNSMLEGNDSLKALVLRSDTLVEMTHPIYPGPLDCETKSRCTLYVPERLVEEYRRSPRWEKMNIERIEG